MHKRKFPVLGPIATWTLRLMTGGVLVGVYQFNTNDIGASLTPPFSVTHCRVVFRSDGIDHESVDSMRRDGYQ